MVPFCLSRYSSAQVQDGGRKETSVGFISLRLLQKPLGPGQISTFTVAPLHHPMLFNIITMVQAILLATVYVAITVPYRAAFNDNTTSTCSGLSSPPSSESLQISYKHHRLNHNRHRHVQGGSFQMVLPRKILSMEVVPNMLTEFFPVFKNISGLDHLKKITLY